VGANVVARLWPQKLDELVDGESGIGNDAPQSTLSNPLVIGHDNAGVSGSLATIAATIL
jgi:hypothetical protein